MYMHAYTSHTHTYLTQSLPMCSVPEAALASGRVSKLSQPQAFARGDHGRKACETFMDFKPISLIKKGFHPTPEMGSASGDDPCMPNCFDLIYRRVREMMSSIYNSLMLHHARMHFLLKTVVGSRSRVG